MPNRSASTTDVESHTESDAELGEVNKKFDKDKDNLLKISTLYSDEY